MKPVQQIRTVFYRLGMFFGPERSLLFSFLLFILLGAFVLHSPLVVRGEQLGIIDALFTATSATCVTGLAVVDTGSRFNFYGQLLILVMIQSGGLGIMTFSTAFLYLLEGRLSLRGRNVLQETFTQGPTQNIKSLLRTVFFATMIIEGFGAAALTFRFLFDMPPLQAIWFGVFHSVSAFCNAGFGLFPDSLMGYKGDLLVNFTVSVLIILGGLGFIVIYEVQEYIKNKNHVFSLHSRMVLRTTAFLLLFGTSVIFTLEYYNSIEYLAWDEKILTSFFQSVTTRTAGFNSLDIAMLSNPTLLIMIFLMFIGASPASCGGGIKTTTFAIIMSQIKARTQGSEDTVMHFRKIPQQSVSRAITVSIFSVVTILFATMVLMSTELAGLSHTESRGLFVEYLFEVTSAFATVGLSLGTTVTLSDAGRLLITLMMFMGRLGPLTVAMAVARKKAVVLEYPEEDVLVG
jgi:trk system potassium uptake protein TrkH